MIDPRGFPWFQGKKYFGNLENFIFVKKLKKTAFERGVGYGPYVMKYFNSSAYNSWDSGGHTKHWIVQWCKGFDHQCISGLFPFLMFQWRQNAWYWAYLTKMDKEIHSCLKWKSCSDGPRMAWNGLKIPKFSGALPLDPARGFGPGPHWEAYSAPRPPAVFYSLRSIIL